MKNPWNDIIPLLPLQEFMSLTSVQKKLCASAPCFHLLRRLSSCSLDTSPSSTQVASPLDLHRVDGDPRVHHFTGQPSIEFDFHIDSKCAFV
ncbi:hypothetical protein BHM03_00048544 [Ensete ventricosum]|uniref:Uncharacterized protein n=1 Tax=Ensete ventricosum TaxID=4639 RepID=A0A445MLG4_ENSVE|nr:hypothetical protein BHM03_00048544 [Ensete ventricosum]